jgi:RNA polymerase sigma-70 factor, ECF subfamily
MQTGIHDSDDRLATDALGGDERAAARLYHRYADRVYRIAYRVLLDEGLAKDAAQETWIKVFKNLNRFRSDSSFGAWVSSIAVRTAIDMLRKTARIPLMECIEECYEHPASNENSARNWLADQEFEAEALRVLKQLPDTQRAAFVLRHFEEVTLREIGEILDCTEGTVKAHIYRAMKVVRKELARFQRREMDRS